MMTEIEASIDPYAFFGDWQIFLRRHWPLTFGWHGGGCHDEWCRSVGQNEADLVRRKVKHRYLDRCV